MKRYIQTRKKEKEVVRPRGVTPFQSRRIIEKNKNSKTVEKILEKSRTGEHLGETKDNWLIVK